jgi:hypothetical protein
MHKQLFQTAVMIALVASSIGCGSGGSSTSTSGMPNTNVPPYDGNTYPAQIDRTEATQTGSVYYVDPATGNIGNSGSAASPWNTLQAVIENNKIESQQPASLPYQSGRALVVKNAGAPVKAGDTIILLPGHHGDILITRYFNAGYINVIAEPGATVSRLHVQAGSKWRFKGLTVRPNAGYSAGYSLVFLESHDWSGPVYNITIDDFTIYSVTDSSTAWSTTDPTDWNTLSCDGIVADGDTMTIRRNSLKNVDFGISLSGNYGLVSGNTIENFAGDGMRGLGNDLFFEYNTVKNCYAVNANHDDGFQSWSINDDPPRERVVLRGNTIINYTDPNQPFRGTLQGIGCFDGWYINWVVENNVIITDHWHGISLYGAISSRIVNNTVIDRNNASPGPPWIGFFNHKNGTPCVNCIIRNNIAPSYAVGAGATADHNYTIPNYASYASLFADYQNYNLRLRPGSTLIDAGSADKAPLTDITGASRPTGAGVDLGAYENY